MLNYIECSTFNLNTINCSFWCFMANVSLKEESDFTFALMNKDAWTVIYNMPPLHKSHRRINLYDLIAKMVFL